MAEATIIDTPPPSPPPAPTTSISVTPESIDKGPTPPPPKPGSAMDRMRQSLRKAAHVEEETPTPAAVTPKTKTQEAPVGEPPEAQAKEEGAPPNESPPEKTEAPTSAEKKKLSPWKLVDEHKAARLKAETELAELRKTMADPAKLKELEEKAATYEKRAKELDDHIKYVDYTKSSEFVDKYQKPYEAAWQKAMADLGELTVAGENGQERPLAPADLLALVNMPLQKAREQAEAAFGNFADDVMAARKEIRGLFDAQSRALEEAKKLGSERIAAMQKQQKEAQEAVHKEISNLWTEANQSAVKDETYGKFFKPIEGDEEGNTRLQRGYEMADRAFTINPTSPGLTSEQRAEVVRLHAAIRNRAAGFGRLAYQNSKLEAEIATLKAELGKYKGAQPGAGSPPPQAQAGPSNTREDVFSALRKLAH